MKLKKFSSLTSIGLVIFSAAPFFVYAQTIPPSGISTLDDVGAVLCKILGYLFGLTLFFAVVMTLWAAYLYLFSEGDAEKVTKATKTLTYVAIAVVVAILARALPFIIADFLSASITFPCAS